MKLLKRFFLLAAAVVTVIIVADLIKIFSYKTYPANPPDKIVTKQDELYAELISGNDFIDWDKLNGTLQFIKNEYDVSDFKMVNLIRILYEYREFIPSEIKHRIDSVLLGFRYWMDEPNRNSICYWSENHQILFSSAEYLIGKLYKKNVFSDSGLTGEEHVLKARNRILNWLEMRWLYGFTEFYSGTYYIEDVAALLNLIDFSEDEEITVKSRIVLDLLFYDISTQSFRGTMTSVSGRAYESNRKGGIYEDLGGILPFLSEGRDTPVGMVYSLSRTNNYIVPPVFGEMVNDTSEIVIKQSNGLNISELKAEGLFGTDEKSIMMQWGMEAFTNPEIINNSLRYIKKNNMFSNEFLKDFRYLNFTVFSALNLYGKLSEKVNPSTNGKAIQRGNTYTYKTKDYSLYSVQNYHPGDYADQHHVTGMNIGNEFSLFHLHPARKPDDYAHSPNYWVGYGKLPHVAQHKNISIGIYNISGKNMLDFTHAYFPEEKFDSVFVSHNYLFGKKNDIYCALIGSGDFEFESSDDVIQHGRKSVWIIEAGSKTEDTSFENFVRRIISNPFSFDEEGMRVVYSSRNNDFELTFSGEFKINGEVADFDYPRFDSPYIRAPRKPETLNFEFNGKKLYLDFYNKRREMN